MVNHSFSRYPLVNNYTSTASKISGNGAYMILILAYGDEDNN